MGNAMPLNTGLIASLADRLHRAATERRAGAPLSDEHPDL